MNSATSMNIKIQLQKWTVCLVLIFGISVSASAQGKTHTVKKGETLFSIAKQYNIEVAQLRQWNSLDPNELSVGQVLVVRPPSKDDESVTHTVQKKETLFSISKKYNVSIAEIKAWNNLKSNNLSTGQKLIIYPDSGTSSQKSIVVNKETQQNTYYTVKSGDSLYRIAEAHNMTVNQLKELNDLNTNTIRVGQKLTVNKVSGNTPPSVDTNISSSPQGKFVSYEISGGSESLQQILQRFNMTKEEFHALNEGVKTTSFYSGQTVTVLVPPSKKFENPYLKSSGMQNLGTAPVYRYGNNEIAKPTTNGELYNPHALTAAHSNISLGSVIYIENPENNKGVLVRINDRDSGKGLKLSDAAWKMLDFKTNSPSVNISKN